MKILVADDDRFVRLIMERLLRQLGYEVVVAEDGAEAWRILQQPSAPRLALLDWLMPGMTGLEIIRSLRGRDEAPYTYTILLTANTQKHEIMEGMGAGADDYLVKPFDQDQITARLVVAKRILRLQDRLLAACHQASFQAEHDDLTGLYNRGGILRMLRRELSRNGRSGSSTGVLIFDIDFFKRVNDSHGHLAGDIVLQGVAAVASKCVRDYDFIGRFGGEEFIVVAPQCDSTEVLRIAERIRSSVADRPFPVGDRRIPVTVSVGVALGVTDADRALQGADSALYEAKRAGRNRVEFAAAARCAVVPEEAAALG